MNSLLRGPVLPDEEVSPGGIDFAPVQASPVQPMPTLTQEVTQGRVHDKQPLGFDSGLTTLDDITGAAIRSEWVSSYLLDSVGSDKFSPDFSWSPQTMTKEQRKALNIDNRPQGFVDQLYRDSVSYDHALAIAGEQDQRTEAARLLDRAGTGGTVARVAAAFLDPSAIAVTLVTDGAAAPLILAGKATRIGRAIRGGLLAATSNAAIEAAIVANDPLRSTSDIAVAAVGGFAFGSAIGGLLGRDENELVGALNRAKSTFGKDTVNAISTEEGIAGGLKPTDKAPEPSVVTIDADGIMKRLGAKDFGILPAIKEEGPTSRLHWMLPAIRQEGPVSHLIGPGADIPHIEITGASNPLTKEESILRAGLDEKIKETTTAYTEAAKLAADAHKQAETEFDAGNRVRSMELMAEGDKHAQTAVEHGQTLAELNAIKAKQVTPPSAPVAEKAPGPSSVVGGSVGSGAAPYVDPMLPDRVAGAKKTWKDQRVDKRDVTLQFDLYSKLASSLHDGVSWLVDRLTPNPSGVRKFTGRVQGRTVVEDKEMIHKQQLGEVFRGYNKAYEEWAKANGRRLPGFNLQARRDFGEAVGMEVRAASADAPETVRRAADAARRFHSTYSDMAKSAGVEGFEHIKPNSNYLMRAMDHSKLQAAEEKFGTATVERLITNAIRNAPDREAEIGDDVAQRMAYLYMKWIKTSAYNTEGGMSLAFNNGVISKLRKNIETAVAADPSISEEFRASITPEMIDGLVDSVKNVGQMGVVSRGKFRIAMNEVENITTGDGQKLGFTDLLDNDAERLMLRYSSDMSGAIALARHPDLQIKSMSHWEQLSKDLEATAPTYKGVSKQNFETDMKALEMIRRHLFGQPLHDMTARNATLFRILRDYNFTRLMNKVGLAQIPEFGNAMGQVGFKAMIQHMPILGKITRDAQTGKFDHELLDWIDAIGIGVESELGHPSLRAGEFMDPQTQRLAKVEDVLSVGKKLTSVYSGLAPVTEGLERISAAAAIQKFANIAKGAASLSKERLTSMGLGPAEAEKVFAEMRAHVGWTESGLTGRKIKSLNFEQWNPEARELFKTAVWRWTRRLIQRNDIGDLPMFMTGPAQQLFFQFRAFTLAAWSKQFMHGVRMADAQTAMSFINSTVFGGLGYVALTASNAVGRDDAAQYLKDRLTPEKIGMMGFSRAGWSSIIPAFADTGLMFAGEPSVFAQARTTGLDTNWLAGSASIDLANTVVRAGQGLVNAPTQSDWDYSQQDARALKSLLPFQNAFAISNGLEYLIRDLPKRSRYDTK